MIRVAEVVAYKQGRGAGLGGERESCLLIILAAEHLARPPELVACTCTADFL